MPSYDIHLFRRGGGVGLGQSKDGEEKIIKSDKGLFSSDLNYSSVNDIWEGLEFMV